MVDRLSEQIWTPLGVAQDAPVQVEIAWNLGTGRRLTKIVFDIIAWCVAEGLTAGAVTVVRQELSAL